MLQKLLVLVSIVTMSSACVHIPESLRVAEGANLTEFSAVKTDEKMHLGDQARWGGVIAKVENKTDHTMLEIVHFELKSSMRPTPKDDTQGRFRVYFQGLLDPVIYKEGRSVTAIGHVSASEPGKIGEHEYVYPVLKANHVHLWKEIKQVDVRITHQPIWHTPSLWYHPRPYYSPMRYPYIKNKPAIKHTK